MLENLTLGNISAAILFIVALIGGVGYLSNKVKTWIEKLLDDKFKAISLQIQEVRNEIAAVDSKVWKVDMETCKNFLVRFLADVERGEFIADAEKQRFWEEYQHYIDNKGNSYIKEWVERLKKEEKF